MKRHTLQLDPLVQRKLAAPHAPLTPSESRECLISCIKHGKEAAAAASGKRCVVVLGNTGAGKSAFINLLAGCEFAYEDDDRMVVRADSSIAELMRIGHSNVSETFAPQVEDASSSLGAGFAFADCPGFLDNRGFEINVANAVNVAQTVSASESIVCVVVVNYYSLRADRGKGLQDLLAILLGLFGSVDAVRAHAPSVLFAISQAPVAHPETSKPITLDYLRRTLLNVAGLDEQTAAVLGALSDANAVFLYHLLGRGDPSWLQRDAIVERLRALPPVGSPSSLFQSVLNSEDKERLRGLVAALGQELRAHLASGTPAGFAAAAQLVADLLELRIIEHGFVGAVVEQEVEAAVQERLAAAVATADALFVDGGLEDGEDDDAAVLDAKLEEARAALKGVHAMLAAFESVDVVREQLQPLLTEAAAAVAEKLASAERRRAEACGRRDMAVRLQEALRDVGAHALGPAYNVVREVLVLPPVAAAVREEQRQQQEELARASAAEQAAAPPERRAELEERHGAAARALTMRADAANAAWDAHIDAARARLRRHDDDLLRAEGDDVLAKVGKSIGQLGAVADLSRRGLTPQDMVVAATLLRTAPELAGVKALILSGNQLGGAGITALADAAAHGALRHVERLFLDNVALSDAALGELAAVLAAGAMPSLAFLDVTRNQIGDRGMAALAQAMRGGALARLTTLYAYNNRIGSAGVSALVEGLCEGAAPPVLEKLYLDNNAVRDDGVAVLARAIEGGRLPALKVLHLGGNPAPREMVEAVEGMIGGPARGAPQTSDLELPPAGGDVTPSDIV